MNKPAPEPGNTIADAKRLVKQNRRQGLEALNQLFRSGAIPKPPMDGPYEGELVAVSIAPVISEVVEWIAFCLMPWKGKFFILQEGKGDNIFTNKKRWLVRLLYPFYAGLRDYDRDNFRAFVFKTSVEAGKIDADRQVFRIDYALSENPGLTIRRIVDEVTEVAPGVYLGKIHFRWWWEKWQMIGYFALRKPG